MPNESNPLDEESFDKLFEYEPEPVAGKGIVVTGGTTGIGRAIALLLVAQGAKVLIFGRHGQELVEAMADLKRVGGGEVYGLVADTTNADDVRRVFATADQELGRVDVLVNNAPLAGNSILDSEPDAWRHVIETNLLGYMACARAAADRFRGHKAGHLVNVGAMSAKVGEAGADVYVSTKAAVRGFNDSLAKELNEDGIRVTLIEPGLVGSETTADKVPIEGRAAAQEKHEMLNAEELAHAVLYALRQPGRCDVAVIQIRPTKQII